MHDVLDVSLLFFSKMLKLESYAINWEIMTPKTKSEFAVLAGAWRRACYNTFINRLGIWTFFEFLCLYWFFIADFYPKIRPLD